MTRPRPPAAARRYVVDLVAVAVTLVDDLVAVGRLALGAGDDLARGSAEAHRAAHVVDVLLLGHEVDDRVRGARVELGGVGAVQPRDVARELDDGAPACPGRCRGRAPCSRGRSGWPRSCPRCRVCRSRRGRGCRPSRRGAPRPPRREPSASTQMQVELAVVEDAGVLERLAHGEVRVGQLDVLADERDRDGLSAGVDVRRPTRSHSARSGGPHSRPELLDHHVVELLARAGCGRRRRCRRRPRAEMTASGSTSQNRAILSRMPRRWAAPRSGRR